MTELRNPRTMDLHKLSVDQVVLRVQREDRAVLAALDAARPQICALVEDLVPRFQRGGRLIYLGAGTSGRLGVLDAAEAPPTFQIDPGRIVGIIAGGDGSLRKSSEGKEDDPMGAVEALTELCLTSDDMIVGIAAGGTTPYVLGALVFAQRLGSSPRTALIVCSLLDDPPAVDHLIVLDTGPEVLTGSTRMKAGTATKMALNTISTALMVATGRVYQNLMIDLKASNEKLRDRAARIVSMLTGFNREAAFDLLERAGGSVKIAVLMVRLGVDIEEASILLSQADWRLDKALGEV